MKVTAGPEMLNMLLNAAGQSPAAGGGIGALLPLLQGLGGGGSSGAASIASLLPLLQMMGREQQAPRQAPEPEAAAATEGTGPTEAAADPPPEAATAAANDGITAEHSAGARRRQGRHFAPGLAASAPALLQLLTGLGALNQRPPQPPSPPEPPPEDFDPCSLCSEPCPRRNAAISFDQVRALAATFPGYA